MEQLFAKIKDGGECSADFVTMVVIASTLAGVGLVQNNTVVIVASMLVSPIMGPVLAVRRCAGVLLHGCDSAAAWLWCWLHGWAVLLQSIARYLQKAQRVYLPSSQTSHAPDADLLNRICAHVTQVVMGIWTDKPDLLREGLVSEGKALLLAVLCGFVIGAAGAHWEGAAGTGEEYTWPTDEMAGRGEWGGLIPGAIIALFSGVGVTLSLYNNISGGLVGVAISASLLPPAVNGGICLAEICFGELLTGDPTDQESFAVIAGVSFLLTVLNIVAIIVSGLLTLRLKGANQQLTTNTLIGLASRSGQQQMTNAAQLQEMKLAPAQLQEIKLAAAAAAAVMNAAPAQQKRPQLQEMKLAAPAAPAAPTAAPAAAAAVAVAVEVADAAAAPPPPLRKQEPVSRKNPTEKAEKATAEKATAVAAGSLAQIGSTANANANANASSIASSAGGYASGDSAGVPSVLDVFGAPDPKDAAGKFLPSPKMKMTALQACTGMREQLLLEQQMEFLRRRAVEEARSAAQRERARWEARKEDSTEGEERERVAAAAKQAETEAIAQEAARRVEARDKVEKERAEVEAAQGGGGDGLRQIQREQAQEKPPERQEQQQEQEQNQNQDQGHYQDQQDQEL